MELPAEEVLLASAINFLFEGQEYNEASLLMNCEIKTHYSNRNYDDDTTGVLIEITGNRAVYDVIQNDALTVKDIIESAFKAILPLNFWLDGITARVGLVDVSSSDWRNSLQDLLEGKKALNQGLPIKDKEIFYWDMLRFRAPYEISIAKALNEYNVLFFPNCMARIGASKPTEKQFIEPDFLVCLDGKWGILEVDGETFHTTAAKDHDRDRLFRTRSIPVIERFTANECKSDPTFVVKKFLDILKKNG
jgi:hypothetical protein